MVSLPSYDPSTINDIWDQIANDPNDSRLVNRATQGKYIPGSIFKILTTLEYNILLLLFTNLNRVITRDIIIDKIFLLTGNDVYDNTVTVYIKRIREKLNTDIIKTIKGVGYRVDK